jgi:hypothetical protein
MPIEPKSKLPKYDSKITSMGFSTVILRFHRLMIWRAD